MCEPVYSQMIKILLVSEKYPNTNFDIFPKKQHMKAHFPIFQFFHMFGEFLMVVSKHEIVFLDTVCNSELPKAN